jgi:hypothetical protein
MTIDIQVAKDEDLVRFRETLLREGVPWEEITRRRAGGDMCFIGLHEGRLVHFTWLTRERRVWLKGIGVTLHLEADEA